MTVWQVYLLEINAVTFILSAIDKACARKDAWRVPEAILLLSAVLGGSVGSLLAMLLLRHKTKHKRFTIGVPLILLAQAAIIYFLRNI